MHHKTHIRQRILGGDSMSHVRGQNTLDPIVIGVGQLYDAARQQDITKNDNSFFL
jgi:hypothetical protein